MAYYTGSVNSYGELQTALVNACTANGWAWDGATLSKGAAFVSLFVLETENTSFGAGLRIQGGTGKVGGVLQGASPQQPRLGHPHSGGLAYWPAFTWPSTYHIHIGLSPDEVYVILNTNVTSYWWLAFGVSTVPLAGTGLWLTGSCPSMKLGSSGAWMTESAGISGSYWGTISPGFFWKDGISSVNAGELSSAIQMSANGVWPLYNPVGPTSLEPLIKRYELAWNKAAVLLPAREYEVVASNMRRLLIDAAHARIVRLGSLESGQILQLGADKWRVYPFCLKNTAVPNGGSYINHSGTFGWALRYDGP